MLKKNKQFNNDYYIYRYVWRDKTLYVGRTNCLRRRKYEHKRYMINLFDYILKELKCTDRIKLQYIKTTKENIKELEKQAIAYYQPPMNNQFKNEEIKEKRFYWRNA